MRERRHARASREHTDSTDSGLPLRAVDERGRESTELGGTPPAAPARPHPLSHVVRCKEQPVSTPCLQQSPLSPPCSRMATSGAAPPAAVNRSLAHVLSCLHFLPHGAIRMPQPQTVAASGEVPRAWGEWVRCWMPLGGRARGGAFRLRVELAALPPRAHPRAPRAPRPAPLHTLLCLSGGFFSPARSLLLTPSLALSLSSARRLAVRSAAEQHLRQARRAWEHVRCADPAGDGTGRAARDGRKAQMQQSSQRRPKLPPKPDTPEPTEGRKHIDVQTEQYLEELTDRPIEVDVDTQTDAFMDQLPAPIFIPMKTGVDVETQIYEGDLFDFDMGWSRSWVLVGKTLEQSMMEVMEEEELANMRAHEEHFEQIRNASWRRRSGRRPRSGGRRRRAAGAAGEGACGARATGDREGRRAPSPRASSPSSRALSSRTSPTRVSSTTRSRRRCRTSSCRGSCRR